MVYEVHYTQFGARWIAELSTLAEAMRAIRAIKSADVGNAQFGRIIVRPVCL